jgi:hypothetical protein
VCCTWQSALASVPLRVDTELAVFSGWRVRALREELASQAEVEASQLLLFVNVEGGAGAFGEALTAPEAGLAATTSSPTGEGIAGLARRVSAQKLQHQRPGSFNSSFSGASAQEDALPTPGTHALPTQARRPSRPANPLAEQPQSQQHPWRSSRLSLSVSAPQAASAGSGRASSEHAAEGESAHSVTSRPHPSRGPAPPCPPKYSNDESSIVVANFDDAPRGRSSRPLQRAKPLDSDRDDDLDEPDPSSAHDGRRWATRSFERLPVADLVAGASIGGTSSAVTASDATGREAPSSKTAQSVSVLSLPGLLSPSGSAQRSIPWSNGTRAPSPPAPILPPVLEVDLQNESTHDGIRSERSTAGDSLGKLQNTDQVFMDQPPAEAASPMLRSRSDGSGKMRRSSAEAAAAHHLAGMGGSAHEMNWANKQRGSKVAPAPPHPKDPVSRARVGIRIHSSPEQQRGHDPLSEDVSPKLRRSTVAEARPEGSPAQSRKQSSPGRSSTSVSSRSRARLVPMEHQEQPESESPGSEDDVVTDLFDARNLLPTSADMPDPVQIATEGLSAINDSLSISLSASTKPSSKSSSSQPAASVRSGPAGSSLARISALTESLPPSMGRRLESAGMSSAMGVNGPDAWDEDAAFHAASQAAEMQLEDPSSQRDEGERSPQITAVSSSRRHRKGSLSSPSDGQRGDSSRMGGPSMESSPSRKSSGVPSMEGSPSRKSSGVPSMEAIAGALQAHSRSASLGSPAAAASPAQSPAGSPPAQSNPGHSRVPSSVTSRGSSTALQPDGNMSHATSGLTTPEPHAHGGFGSWRSQPDVSDTRMLVPVEGAPVRAPETLDRFQRIAHSLSPVGLISFLSRSSRSSHILGDGMLISAVQHAFKGAEVISIGVLLGPVGSAERAWAHMSDWSIKTGTLPPHVASHLFLLNPSPVDAAHIGVSASGNWDDSVLGSDVPVGSASLGKSSRHTAEDSEMESTVMGRAAEPALSDDRSSSSPCACLCSCFSSKETDQPSASSSAASSSPAPKSSHKYSSP